MTAETRWGSTIVIAVLVGLSLVALYAAIQSVDDSFSSNGARIYFTARSDSGQPIVAEMGPMVMPNPMMTCAGCHGRDGRGGTVQVMMGSFQAPDIRYKTLAAEEHEEEHQEHPAYDDDLVKRAITQGLDPAGASLDLPMPRWRMAESDLQDLLDFLKSLE
jgi:mono/diheme cytochrome c family protein